MQEGEEEEEGEQEEELEQRTGPNLEQEEGEEEKGGRARGRTQGRIPSPGLFRERR